MQDYNYVNSNCFEITFYLSCFKHPDIQNSDLPSYWFANLESMLTFIESTKLGVYGHVRNSRRQPLEGAVIRVEGIDKDIKTTAQGEYWRLLVPGRMYNITASAPGFVDMTVNVEVPAANAYVQRNFVLLLPGESLSFLRKLFPFK